MADSGAEQAGVMEPYDARAWASIDSWRQRRLEREGRKLVPDRVRARLAATGSVAKDKLEGLPGAERFEQLFSDALRGLTDVGARAARASVRREAVVKAYQKRRHAVTSLADIRKLSLADIDEVKPRLDLAYIASSTVEGAAAGLAVSGGQVLAGGGAVFGAGAGAAPGAATVVGVMAADAAAVLVASQRVVTHVAAYYGYDLDDPAEQLYALGALNLGTSSQVNKAAAYQELNKLVQSLARQQTWQQLNRNGVTKIVDHVYRTLGMRLTQRKLGQAVPVIGVAVGAGLNARLLAKVHDDAEHLYRERFLRERYGLDLAPSVPRESGDTVRVSEIVDAEVVDEESE